MLDNKPDKLNPFDKTNPPVPESSEKELHTLYGQVLGLLRQQKFIEAKQLVTTSKETFSREQTEILWAELMKVFPALNDRELVEKGQLISELSEEIRNKRRLPKI